MGVERLKEPKHPTQKPIKILEHIIKIASNPNDVVLDMFMGVGSTGVAAHNLGRKFVGIEIDKMYFDAAQRRILNNLNKRDTYNYVKNVYKKYV